MMSVIVYTFLSGKPNYLRVCTADEPLGLAPTACVVGA